MSTPRISSFKKILDIRLRANRRNMIISGAVFIISLFGFFTLGMLEKMNSQRELFLSGILLVIFGMSFAAAFLRYEIVRNNMDLLLAISLDEEEI